MSLSMCLSLVTGALVGFQGSWLSIERPPAGPGLVLRGPNSVRPIGSAEPAHWVRAWSAFAIARDGRIEALRPDGTTKVKTETGFGSFIHHWAVSADGKLYAEAETSERGGFALVVRKIPDGRTVRRLGTKQLECRLGGEWEAAPSLEGVAWSPSSRKVAFAHGFGGGVDSGGLARTRVGVLDVQTCRVASWGVGAPVAWLSESALLVRSESTSGEGQSVWIIRDGSRKSPIVSGVSAAGWNGREIVLFREHSGVLHLERWSSTLDKRIAAQAMPGIRREYVYDGVFLGISN